ncbi:glycosyltransferase family 76 protein [Lactarius indigo]|nr:glycosyltransferase family 76 protein [Lactarius indigo]
MSTSDIRRKHIRVLDSLTILSRVSVAALLYLTSSYLPLFDASPHTVVAPSSTLPSFSSSLLRWDAFYFTAIAKAGYSREQHWAFFPGVPSLLRFAASFSPPVADPAFALARVAIVHTLIAIPTTRAIYNLTLIHFGSPSFRFPHRPSLSPPREPRHVVLCTICRTHLHLPLLCRDVRLRVQATPPRHAVLLPSPPHSVRTASFWLFTRRPRCLLHAALPLLPSLLHQHDAYRVFCLAPAANHAQQSSWCNNLIPSIYTYVQRTYWNVGFLSYWTPSQLPNIALALPLLTPLLFYSIPHALSLFRVKRLGGLRPLTTAAHSVHATFLGITLLTSAHTQIALRLLPALPSTYWAAAALLVERPRWGRAYVVWAVLWGATSIVLWAAFLPPA